MRSETAGRCRPLGWEVAVGAFPLHGKCGRYPGISVFSPTYERVDWGKAAFGILRAVKDASAFSAGFLGHRSSCLLTFMLHPQQGDSFHCGRPGHIRRLHHSLTFLGQCSPQVSLGYSILLRLCEQVMELTKNQWKQTDQWAWAKRHLWVAGGATVSQSRGLHLHLTGMRRVSVLPGM